MPEPLRVSSDLISVLTEAAHDRKPVTGWTHNFYRYPARFSPQFAGAVIRSFSRSSELILDPYMGGGTSVVEAVACGRNIIGNDLNSLACFITKTKVTPLTEFETDAVKAWAVREVPQFNYRRDAHELEPFVHAAKTKNLSLVRARFIKKAVAAAIASLSLLPTENAQNFAKCIVLRVSQWALDGRETHTSLSDFRGKLVTTSVEMVKAINRLGIRVAGNGGRATVLNMNAAHLDESQVFAQMRQKVSLVITSPPYPGVHVLYHRWQVDGRRETPAPYWIAGCNDGQGVSFYNFGDRREGAADTYFRTSFETLRAIRRVMRNGGYVVQLVAFNRPDDQLQRYLVNMKDAGFQEVRTGASRIWREVPGRKWHASLLGKTHASNEVVLIHRAI
ncbi:MAG TPA: DNA methyltransferase [Candidatus Acidoferrales bacterium]|nr:DNA methyltransferase [Candidatus Acidoferrales bacterium]